MMQRFMILMFSFSSLMALEFFVSGLSPAMILDAHSINRHVYHVNDTLYSVHKPIGTKLIQLIYSRWRRTESTHLLNMYLKHYNNADSSVLRDTKQKIDLFITSTSSDQSSIAQHPPQQQHNGRLPLEFPNPQYNPDACGLTQLTAFHSVLDTINNSTDQSPNHNARLLLCDPDDLLESSQLQQIAETLLNFTFYYGSKRNLSPFREMKSGPVRPEKLSISYQSIFLSSVQSQVALHWLPPVEIGIAITKKMDISSILRASGYYSFEDAEGMINDAAQIFAAVLLDQWWKNIRDQNSSTQADPVSGVLIFLSLQDRVCFISASEEISDILPWWRLDRVVASMKTNLQTGDFGQALLNAILGISNMLDTGPPQIREKIHDFCSRFGFVLSFAIFAFLFAIFGEFRDRHRKLHRADIRSRLTVTEKLIAKKLQQGFKTTSCPICLDSFRVDSEDGIKRVDSFGIPQTGNDGLPLKLLRCGHIMDNTCWLCWVKSGHGTSSLKCPVCREDLLCSSHTKTDSTNSLTYGELDGLSIASRYSGTYGSLSRNT